MPTLVTLPALDTSLRIVSDRQPVHTAQIPTFANADVLVDVLRPEEPVYGLRSHVVRQAATWFLNHFPGRTMYAVKTNPEPRAIEALVSAGVRDFDVASLGEIELIAAHAPDANMFFMHPVKPEAAIAKAYYAYGVRAFSLDSHAELRKIQRATNYATDLQLFVRVSIPNEHAALSLAGKFGVPMSEAADLVMETRRVAAKLGICFHVGSQSMDARDYRTAMLLVSDLIDQTGVRLDFLDVGGGFPSVYPGMAPDMLDKYMDVIRQSFKDFEFDAECELLCEPGRALVAEAGSTIVRVDLRKDDMLFINDGTYGSLFDAGTPNFNYPVRALRPGGSFSSELQAFGFYGPTCDSMDVMHGPFMLPSDITEGDWIEIGQLGAYGTSMRTQFNGFYSDAKAELEDAPMLSMYTPAMVSNNKKQAAARRAAAAAAAGAK